MAARGGLKWSVISNVGAYVVSVAIALVVSPIVIRSLGDERYGIWALVAQITGYYGALDLGLRGAITHYTARHLAKQDNDGLQRSIATGFWILTALGAVALAVGAAIAYLFPSIFQIGEVPVGTVRTAMLIMSAVVAVGLPMSTLSGALVGFERLDLVNGIQMTVAVLGAVATYWAMKSGEGLVALACIQAGVAMGRWILTVFFLRRHIGGALPISFGLSRRKSLKELGGYGGRSLVIQLSTLVISRTDLIVIGVFLGTSWITIYTIGQMLVEYFSRGASSITRSFTPRLTHVAARDDHDELERVYMLGARTAACVVAPLAGCMYAFGSDFIRLWVGGDYVEGDAFERSDVIMYLLLGVHALRALQSISWQLLFATGKQGFLARLRTMEAIANLGLSVVLVQYLGIVGVALGTVIPLAITHVFFVPRFMARTYGIPVSHFIVRGVGRPVLVGLALFGFGTLVTTMAPPRGWGDFVWEAIATTVVGAAMILFFVFDAGTRQRVLRQLGRGGRGAA